MDTKITKDTKTKQPSGLIRYFGIALASIMMGIVFMGQSNLFSPVLPVLRDQLGLSSTQTAIFGTLNTLTQVCAVQFLHVIYKKGVKPGIIVPWASAFLGAFVLSRASGFGGVLAGRIFASIAMTLGGMMPASLLVKRWFNKQRGLVLGLASAGSAITGMFLSTTITSLAKNQGVAAAEMVMMAFIGIGGLIIFILIKNTPEELGMSPYGGVDYVEVKKEKKKRKRVQYIAVKPLGNDKWIMCGIVICAGCIGFCSLPNFTLACTLMGFDAVYVASLYAMQNGLGMIGKPGYGWVADMVGTPVANVIFVVMMIVGHAIMAILNASTPVGLLYIVIVTFGLGCYALTTVGMPLWVSELSSNEEHAKNLKTFQTCATGGGFLFSLLPGVIADATGSYGVFYWITVACLVVVLVGMVWIYKRHTVRCTTDEEVIAARAQYAAAGKDS